MYLISMLLIIVCLMGMLLTCKYEKQLVKRLNRREHYLKILYPFCLFCIDRTKMDIRSSKNLEKKEQLEAVYIGQEKKQIYRLHLAKKMSLLLASILVVSFLTVILWITDGEIRGLVDGNYLYRKDDMEQKISLQANIKNKEKEISIEEIHYTIGARKYSRSQYEKKLKEAKAYIKDNFLGKNTKENQIKYPLNLVEDIPNNLIQVQWEVGLDGLVEEDGFLNNLQIPKEGKGTELLVRFYYEQWEDEMVFPIIVIPPDLPEEKVIRMELEKELEQAELESAAKEKVKLPVRVNGYEIEYKQSLKDRSGSMFVVGCIACFIIFVFYDKKIQQKMKKRELEMNLDYPELVNKFTLLLSAGMNMNRAWGKIATEYQEKLKKGKERRYAYDEWLITWHELHSGISEITALERFGRRTKLLNYLKFSSLLSQNLKKGSKGLSNLLEYEVLDALEERKTLAKRLGEEAGTKLLVPMAIMLILVLFIIMVPAFLSFS